MPRFPSRHSPPRCSDPAGVSGCRSGRWVHLLLFALASSCGGKQQTNSSDGAGGIIADPGQGSGGGESGGNTGTGGRAEATGGSSWASGGTSQGEGTTLESIKQAPPTLEASDSSCSGCTNFLAQTLVYQTWVSSVAFDGDTLLAIRDIQNAYAVDLLRPPTAVDSLVQVPGEVSTRMFLDFGQAVLVDWGQDENSLSVRQEARNFTGIAHAFRSRVSPRTVLFGELHVVVGRDDDWSYQRGPLEGPMEEVEVFEEQPLLTLGTVITPVRIEPQEDTGNLELSLDGGEARVTVPAGEPFELIAGSAELFSLGRTPAGRLDLVWESGARSIGSDQPPAACDGQLTAYAPDVCPSDAPEHSTRTGVVLAANQAIDEDGVAWIAYVMGDLRDSCSWTSGGGCFETLPCDCYKSLKTRPSTASLYVQSVTGLGGGVRIDLGEIRDATPILRLVEKGGRIHVAIADSSYESRIHLISFDTP